jgi:hypothetical protein
MSAKPFYNLMKSRRFGPVHRLHWFSTFFNPARDTVITIRRRLLGLFYCANKFFSAGQISAVSLTRRLFTVHPLKYGLVLQQL